MKFVSVREARENLSGILQGAQTESVCVLKHGRPLAVIRGAQGQDVSAVLERDEEALHLEIAQRARDDKRDPSGSKTIEEILADETGKARRGRKPPKRTPIGRRKKRAA